MKGCRVHDHWAGKVTYDLNVYSTKSIDSQIGHDTLREKI